jgi:hypothetical protein
MITEIYDPATTNINHLTALQKDIFTKVETFRKDNMGCSISRAIKHLGVSGPTYHLARKRVMDPAYTQGQYKKQKDDTGVELNKNMPQMQTIVVEEQTRFNPTGYALIVKVPMGDLQKAIAALGN